MFMVTGPTSVAMVKIWGVFLSANIVRLLLIDQIAINDIIGTSILVGNDRNLISCSLIGAIDRQKIYFLSMFFFLLLLEMRNTEVFN